ANANFAITVETGNQKLIERAANINTLRAENQPTVPSLLGLEKETNPFLRADIVTVAEAVGLPSGSPVEVFREIRTRKDNF
ncbi:MAG: hydroxyacylglutathione hydrolase, partial [Rhodospirillaceae bacterium]|nr:hydroxyacylglutathione hydrolase [Rhodospirillaceae bacterium]